MASPHTVSPVIGVDVNTIVPAALVGPSNNLEGPALGTQVWGTNGRRYVYAQANATISASTAVCTVNATTFLVTASGGAYTSPSVGVVAGDRGWWSAASV